MLRSATNIFCNDLCFLTTTIRSPLPGCPPAARRWRAGGYRSPRTGRWLSGPPPPPGSWVSPRRPGALEVTHTHTHTHRMTVSQGIQKHSTTALYRIISSYYGELELGESHLTRSFYKLLLHFNTRSQSKPFLDEWLTKVCFRRSSG